MAVFGDILLEDFGLPMPGEVMLITAFQLASQDDMSIPSLLSGPETVRCQIVTIVVLRLKEVIT